MSAPAVLAEHVQQPSLDAMVELFEIDATALGGDIYRVVSGAHAASAIVWQGHTYSPCPIEASGFDTSSKGPLPTPRIRVANVNLAFSGLAIAFNDLLGCTVTRHRTFKRFLDGEPDADPAAEWPPDVYRINQKVNQNKVFIEWELAASFDQEGRLLPGRPVLQSTCVWRTRRWDADAAAFDYTRAICPYVGSTYFDENGEVVLDPADERFSKRFATCCKKRFPTGVLPFGGFPGVARV